MAEMKTPGVYIVEKDAFPNSVVEVPTAVPAFIGYTERAENGSKSLLNKPWRISSFAEYLQYFGGGPKISFNLSAAAEGETGDIIVKGNAFSLSQNGKKYQMFNSIRLFFQNGGGPCYIVSVGHFKSGDLEKTPLDSGIASLKKESEPTIVVIPDAVSLDQDNCYSLQQSMLKHCGEMMSRIAILDVFRGDRERQDEDGDPITAFRGGVGANYLNYGTAYYPWLNTTIVQDNELSFKSLSDESLAAFQTLLQTELDLTGAASDDDDSKKKELREFIGNITEYSEEKIEARSNSEEGDQLPSANDVNKTLILVSPTFNNLLTDIKNQLNLIAPSSAMAGLMTMVDNTRGVWKAPANVSVNSVVTPAVNITHEDQEELNVTLNGKSINAIRSFIGEGVLIWGARTLDGNSQDWRYINVRRTMIMLEQSVKAAAKAYVFEPNDANTWTTVKAMIENFLFLQWKKGALVGSTPGEAYIVQVGLGNTMTPNDILDGILRITVLVAISRPAEFIEITFQQKMQES